MCVTVSLSGAAQSFLTQLGDPRSALLERYRDFDDFRAQYRAAVDRGVEQRTLLAEDVAELMKRADLWRPLFD